MPSSIAILGASGAVGSALSTHLLRSGLLLPRDTLQLVGHGEPGCTGKLLAIRTDLLDAFDDQSVRVDVAPDIEDAKADLVIVAAGVPMPPGCTDRSDMARANLPVFQHIAAVCGRSMPYATYIVVSNPVELAVHVLAHTIDRKRVLGMGAEQDSLRFARSIARTLGISRRDVRASVWGEHGRHMVPLWSSVELRGHDLHKQQRLTKLKQRAAAELLATRVQKLQEEVQLHLMNGSLEAAYKLIEAALPDARIFVEPFVTASAIHSTPNATANAVLQTVLAWKEDDHRRLHAQVMLHGEMDGMLGVCGVPVTLGQRGWEIEPCEEISGMERLLVANAFDAIQSSIGECNFGHAQEPGEIRVAPPAASRVAIRKEITG